MKMAHEKAIIVIIIILNLAIYQIEERSSYFDAAHLIAFGILAVKIVFMKNMSIPSF